MVPLPNLLANNSLTDVTLNIKGKELQAHKAILTTMSPVFEIMFNEGYTEHRDNYIKIEDVDSDVFEEFLRFLYSGQVEHLDEVCFDLFAAADKYEVQPLKEICIQHIGKITSVDNAVDILALADCYGDENLKLQTQKFIENNMADVVKTDAWASLGSYFDVPKRPYNNGLDNGRMSVRKLIANYNKPINSLTDVILNIKGTDFEAHKVILTAMSPVFETMFKEGYMEHREGYIENYFKIEGIDRDVFKEFLRFLYSGQVEHLDEVCFDLFAAADKYEVQPLREICIQHIGTIITVDNAVDILVFADGYGVENLKLQAQKFIENNIANVVKTDAWSCLGINSGAAKRPYDNGPVYDRMSSRPTAQSRETLYALQC
jgi:speckle-type POZ protein